MFKITIVLFKMEYLSEWNFFSKIKIGVEVFLFRLFSSKDSKIFVRLLLLLD
jgi:hypothetical protein